MLTKFNIEIEEVLKTKTGTEVFKTSKKTTFVLIIKSGLGINYEGETILQPLCTMSEEGKRQLAEGVKGNLDLEASALDRIGQVWKFVKEGISFSVGNSSFKSVRDTATLEFTQKGVVADGFEIKTLNK